MTAPASRRLGELDILRGFAIIFVVYLHAYFSPWEVTPARDKLAMHAIHLFAHAAVPVFLFISGFLLARERESTFAAFLRKKAVRIGIPLVTWMFIAFVYRAWQEGGVDRGLLKALALFDISGQFYYLFVLPVFYVAFFFVRHWPLRKLAWLALAAFVVNLATIAFYEQSTISGDFATLAYRNPLTWVFSFTFGLYAARRWASLEWTARWSWPGATGMGVLFAYYLWQGERGGGYPSSYFGVSVFLFSCLGLVVFPALLVQARSLAASAIFLRPLQELGRYSFAIYLVHMPLSIGWLTTKVVSDSRLRDDYTQLMNGIFVVGFLGALVAVVALDVLVPRSRIFLGIEPRRTTTPTPRSSGTPIPTPTAPLSRSRTP